MKLIAKTNIENLGNRIIKGNAYIVSLVSSLSGGETVMSLKNLTVENKDATLPISCLPFFKEISVYSTEYTYPMP